MVVDESLVCYILDKRTGTRVNFNIEKPQGYSDAYNANFQAQEVRGRSSPFQAYMSSGPRSINFSVLLSLDYRRDLAEQTDQVRNMLKPYRSQGSGAILPPFVHIVIGKALDVDAILQSFQADWDNGYKEGVFRTCTWTFSLVEVEENSSYNTNTGADINADVPAGLDYKPGQYYTQPEQSAEIGETYTVEEDTVSYQTSNEANNNRAVSVTGVVVPGTYYVDNRKGNAAKLVQEGEVQGWITI